MKALFWVILVFFIGIVGYVMYDAQTIPSAMPPVTATTTIADLPAIIPGEPSVLYKDPRFGFSIYYPSTAILKGAGFEGFLSRTKTPLIAFTLNPQLFEGSNLTEAGVYVGATTSPSVVALCTEAVANSSEIAASSTVAIHGTSFNEFESTGAAAGNIYQEKSYRAVVGSACLEFVEMLHSSNIGNYKKGTVTAFDSAKFSSILEALLNTVVFVSPAAK